MIQKPYNTAMRELGRGFNSGAALGGTIIY
jgi:hypothetical protein